MSIDYQALANRICILRKERGFTQEELSERALLSPHYIGNIEQGVRKPSLRSIERICRALGVTFDQIFADSITDEMAAGISVCLHDENTLRQAPDIFFDALSDYFDWEDDEELIAFGAFDWPEPKDEPAPRPMSLSDYLLQMNFDDEA